MYYKKIFVLMILLFVLPIIVFSMPGCESSQEPESTPKPPPESTPAEHAPESPPTQEPAGAPTGPVKVHLSMSDEPLLEKPVQLSATFNIYESYPDDIISNIIAKIELPDGFEFVEGESEWKGALTKGTEVQINALVMAVKTGKWTIGARATAYSPTGEYMGGFGGYDEIYTSVSEDSAIVSDRPIQTRGIPYATPSDPPETCEVPPPNLHPPQRIEEWLVPEPSSESIPSENLSSLLDGEGRFDNPLTITGRFRCKISEDSLPSTEIPRVDVWAPMVWGGVFFIMPLVIIL